MIEKIKMDGQLIEDVIVETDVYGSNNIQIVFTKLGYEDVLKLVTTKNNTIELIEDNDEVVKICEGYTTVTSVVMLFATKNDFWEGTRVVAVLEKTD